TSKADKNWRKESLREVVGRLGAQAAVDDGPAGDGPAVVQLPEKRSGSSEFSSPPMLDGEFQCLRLHELALVDPALEIIRDLKMGCLEAEEAISSRNLLIIVLHNRALRVPVGAKGNRITRSTVWKHLRPE